MLSSKLGPVFLPRKNTFRNLIWFTFANLLIHFLINTFKYLDSPNASTVSISWICLSFFLLFQFYNHTTFLIFLVYRTSYKLWDKLWFLKMHFRNLPLVHSRHILCSLTSRILLVTPSLNSFLILCQLFM